MRKLAWVGASAAAMLAASAFIVPAVASAAADPLPATSPTPMPSFSAAPCRTGPAVPTPSETPPTAPGTPEVVRVVLNVAYLRWAPSTSPDGIACYYVREDRDGVPTNVATFQPAVTEGSVLLPFPPPGVESQTHLLYVVAVDSRGTESPPSGTVAVTILNDLRPPLPPPAVCEVKAASWSWPGGMLTNIEVTNTGSHVINDWRLTFTFPDPGQRVTSGWSANWSQTGTEVTATGMPWNRNISPGQTLRIGFTGTHAGANPDLDEFRINGARCGSPA